MSNVEQSSEHKAENSFLITLYHKDIGAYNVVCPVTPSMTIERKDKIRFMTYADLSFLSNYFKIGDEVELHVDYTDDPTPQNAGSVVSLGYFLIRFTMEKVKLISFNPLIVEVEPKYYQFRLNRCQRRSLIEDVLGKIKPLTPLPLNIDDTSVLHKHYFLPQNYESVFLQVCCIFGKTNHLRVEVIDTTSFYGQPITIEQSDHKTKKQAQKAYEATLKKYGGELKHGSWYTNYNG